MSYHSKEECINVMSLPTSSLFLLALQYPNVSIMGVRKKIPLDEFQLLVPLYVMEFQIPEANSNIDLRKNVTPLNN
jgi:hypothetical protein